MCSYCVYIETSYAELLSTVAGKAVGYAVGRGVNEIRKAVSPAEKKTKEYEDLLERFEEGSDNYLSELRKEIE